MYFWLRDLVGVGKEGGENEVGWIKKNFNDWACFKLS